MWGGIFGVSLKQSCNMKKKTFLFVKKLAILQTSMVLSALLLTQTLSWAEIYGSVAGVYPHDNGCKEIHIIFYDDMGTPHHKGDDKKIGSTTVIHCPDKKSGSVNSPAQEGAEGISGGILPDMAPGLKDENAACATPQIYYIPGQGLWVKSAHENEWMIDVMDLGGKSLISGKTSSSEQFIPISEGILKGVGLYIVRMYSQKCANPSFQKIVVQ